MVKPNYAFARRQKVIAKKQKRKKNSSGKLKHSNHHPRRTCPNRPWTRRPWSDPESGLLNHRAQRVHVREGGVAVVAPSLLSCERHAQPAAAGDAR